MFRSFRFFGPRQLGLFTAFSLMKFTPYIMESEEAAHINAKLKRKLDERYHHRKDISFELDEEKRYSSPYAGRKWSFSLETPTTPSPRKSLIF